MEQYTVDAFTDKLFSGRRPSPPFRLPSGQESFYALSGATGY